MFKAKNRFRRGLAIPMFLGFAAVLSSSGQVKPKPDEQEAVRPQKPLRHEIGVVLKLIPVVVLDKNGNPVPDLKKEDFTLTDNGEPITLTEFERSAYRFPRDGTEGRIVETPLAAKPRLLNRRIIFLFDFATGEYTGVRKAVEAALHFVDAGLLPGDEVGLITHSYVNGLQVREFLTSDHPKIRKIIESFGLHSGAGSALNEEQKAADRSAAEVPEDATFASPLSLEKRKPVPVEDHRLLIKIYIERMMALAQALRYLPGPKNLIYFSGGITTGQMIAGSASPQKTDLDSDLRRSLTELLREMATSNVAIYPMYTGIPTEAADFHKMGTASLMDMAAATGGRYFGYVKNYVQHIEKFQTLTAAYYVLGYPINEQLDGRYHKIKVKVGRPGFEVRAQSGYLNPKEYADYTDVEKRIQLIDLALAEIPLLQNPVRFPMAALTVSTGPADTIGIAAEISLDELRERGLSKVEILRLAFNDADAIIDIRRTEEDLRNREERSAVLTSFLTAPPGRVKCRIVVRDLETGKAAVAGAITIIPNPDEREVRIYPPLFIGPARGQYVFRESSSGLSAKGKASKTTAEAFFLDPIQYVPDFSTTLRTRSEVRAVVSCTGPEEVLAGIEPSLTLFDKLDNESRKVALTVEALGTSLGTRVFLIRFLVPDVEPDDYLMIFAAEGPDGPLSRISRDFTIDLK